MHGPAVGTELKFNRRVKAGEENMVDGRRDLHRDIVDKGLSRSTGSSWSQKLTVSRFKRSVLLHHARLDTSNPTHLLIITCPWNIVSDFSLSSYFLRYSNVFLARSCLSSTSSLAFSVTSTWRSSSTAPCRHVSSRPTQRRLGST